jgi:hypothetical protein
VALSPAEMDSKIDEHFAFEARDDVEGVLATLPPTPNTMSSVRPPAPPVDGKPRAPST